MSRDEERSIEHDCARLVARYAQLSDAANWEETALLFAPDGRMARPADPDAWINGRAAILTAFKARPARQARHLCSNIVVQVLSDSEAHGETTLALFTPDDPPRIGLFEDRFTRTDAGWLFLERRGRLLF